MEMTEFQGRESPVYVLIDPALRWIRFTCCVTFSLPISSLAVDLGKT